LTLQVIFCGDFFQLPPVTKGVGTGYSTDRFAFDAVCWEELFTPANIVTLSQVFRQRDDKFVGALERLRRGVVTDEDLTLYRSCGRSLDASDGIKPVLL
jgi:ATP-dependent DNA helicase PIF1